MIYFVLLALANIVVSLSMLKISASRHYFEFQYSAVNPLIFFLFLSIFFNIDFYILWESDGLKARLYEIPVELGRSDVLYGYFIYTLMFYGACIGIYFSHINWVRSRPQERAMLNTDGVRSQHRSATLIILFFFSLGIYSLIEMNSLSFFSARQSVFRDRVWLIAAFSFVIPSLCIYLASNLKNIYVSVIAIMLCAVIMYGTGTRGHIIYIALIFAIWLQLRGYRISKVWLIAAVPIITLFLVLERYYRRYSGRSINFGDFLAENDGVFTMFFHSGEISMAEVITTIIFELENFDRFPFESFIGLAMFPAPRSIFTFKPTGASAVFTEYVAPVRRAVSGSELATTGYGDIIMQFGIYLSPIVMFILAYLWHRLCLQISARGARFAMLWMPLVIWCAYIFLRSGVFDLGTAAWYFVIVYWLYILLAKVLGSNRGRAAVRVLGLR